VDLWRRFW
jgi:transposase